MIGYMKQHECYVTEQLNKNPSAIKLNELLRYHDKHIHWMQHERLVHLLTMLFVGLFALLTLGFTVIYGTTLCFILTGLLMLLSAAYVIHYYRLENGIQRWYLLSDTIRGKI